MDEIHYKNLVKDIDGIVSNFNNCCKKNCAYCCYQMIEVYDFERSMIRNAVNELSEEKKEIVRINLNNWFDYFNENTPENKILDENDTINNFINLSLTKKKQCPLLIDNLCSIYNNRPLTCRVHVVENSPEKCEKDPYRASSPKSNDLRSKLMQYIASMRRSELLLLPFVIAEEIKTDRKVKVLKKIYV